MGMSKAIYLCGFGGFAEKDFERPTGCLFVFFWNSGSHKPRFTGFGPPPGSPFTKEVSVRRRELAFYEAAEQAGLAATPFLVG
jgi:hypothetical protein